MSSAYYMTFESEDSYNRHISKVEREAEARALEEAADALTLAPYTAINYGSPHRWPYQSWLRARAAEYRKAVQ